MSAEQIWPDHLTADFAAAAVRLTTAMSPSGQHLLFGCVELFPHKIPLPPSHIPPRTKRIGETTLVCGITVMPVSEALEWYESALEGAVRIPGITHRVTATTNTLAPEPPLGRLVVSSDLPFEARWHSGLRLMSIPRQSDP
jgi:hypothetical protein